jgi:hypothetical protein
MDIFFQFQVVPVSSLFLAGLLNLVAQVGLFFAIALLGERLGVLAYMDLHLLVIGAMLLVMLGPFSLALPVCLLGVLALQEYLVLFWTGTHRDQGREYFIANQFLVAVQLTLTCLINELAVSGLPD